MVRLGSPKSYYPVALSLALTWGFASLLILAKIRPSRPVITPVEEPEPSAPPTEALSSPAPYINTLIFIVLLTVAGLVMLYIARRSQRLFKLLIGSLIWLVSFGISVLYLLTIANLYAPWLIRLWIPFGAAMATLLAYSMMRGGDIASATAASVVAAGSGAVMGISIPYWTFLVLVVGISVYDTVAVFRGHLSTLSKEEAPQLRGLTVEAGDVTLGLGDLFFYSLTASAIMWNYGVIPALASTTALVAGYMTVLQLLRRRRILPGLPIPLLTALALGVLTSILILPQHSI